MQAIYSNAARFTTLNNLCDPIIMVAVVFSVVLCQALHSDKKGKFLVFPWKILIAYESLGRRLNLPVI